MRSSLRGATRTAQKEYAADLGLVCRVVSRLLTEPATQRALRSATFTTAQLLLVPCTRPGMGVTEGHLLVHELLQELPGQLLDELRGAKPFSVSGCVLAATPHETWLWAELISSCLHLQRTPHAPADRATT